MKSAIHICIITTILLCACSPERDEKIQKEQIMQIFPIEIDGSPLTEGITISDGIAHFESNPPTAGSQADIDFLKRLPRTRCWYGACNCNLHPIIISTEKRFTELPLASEIIKELRARNLVLRQIVWVRIPLLYSTGNEDHRDLMLIIGMRMP